MSEDFFNVGDKVKVTKLKFPQLFKNVTEDDICIVVALCPGELYAVAKEGDFKHDADLIDIKYLELVERGNGNICDDLQLIQYHAMVAILFAVIFS